MLFNCWVWDRWLCCKFSKMLNELLKVLKGPDSSQQFYSDLIQNLIIQPLALNTKPGWEMKYKRIPGISLDDSRNHSSTLTLLKVQDKEKGASCQGRLSWRCSSQHREKSLYFVELWQCWEQLWAGKILGHLQPGSRYQELGAPRQSPCMLNINMHAHAHKEEDQGEGAAAADEGLVLLSLSNNVEDCVCLITDCEPFQTFQWRHSVALAETTKTFRQTVTY